MLSTHQSILQLLDGGSVQGRLVGDPDRTVFQIMDGMFIWTGVL